MEKLDDITREFITESRESMERYDRELLALENNPLDTECISSIFRVVHTLKGSCGYLGFAKLEALSHRGENLLSHLRDGTLLANPEIITFLFRMGDTFRELLAAVENGDAEGPDCEGILSDLEFLRSDWTGKKIEEPAAKPPASEAPAPRTSEQSPEAATPAGGKPSADFSGLFPSNPMFVDADIAAAESGPQDAAPASAQAHEIAWDAPGPAAKASGDVGAANRKPGIEPAAKPGKEAHASADQTLRVDVSLLDKMMNLVGELVLVRNQVLQHELTAGHGPLAVTFQHLNSITTELQEGIMKTRMQPINNVWNKFPRLVRELSLACGKQVQLEMEGGDTELDKTILEAIKDPLTHLLRNSVDHGIETAEARVAKGKPAHGRIFLKAYHMGGQVNLEISDDGAGIDCGRVAKKALEKGLVTPDAVGRMQEWELAQLIFLPGFSTAEAITNVSGRGVGMDVVKTSVEKIGGTIDLANRPGLGLTLKIKIPLTLAIIPALIVETYHRRYAIPQVNVLEVVRLKDEARGEERGVEWIQDSPVYRLRGDILPLVSLERLFGCGPAASAEGASAEVPRARGDREGAALEKFVIVAQADSHHFGILVHAVQETQEIVVKPMGKHLKTATLFAGATIMGDGKVALILDVPALAQNANFSRGRAAKAAGRAAEHNEDRGNKESMLIASVEAYGLIAVPLASLSRLEELPASALEIMAGTEVVQSRGRIMPIVRMGRCLRDGSESDADAASVPASGAMGNAGVTLDKGKLALIVFTRGSASAGFMVDKVLDIVDAEIDMHLPATRPGIRGSTVLKGRATEVVDLSVFASRALPAVFGPEGKA